MNYINEGKNKQKLSFTVTGLLVALYIAHKLLPAVGSVMPSIVYAGLFLIVLVKVSPAWIRGGFLQSDLISMLPLLSIVVLDMINRYLLKANISGIPMYLYGELQVFLYGIIAFYYIRFSEKKRIKTLLGIILLMYIITAATTAIGCMFYPNAARWLATVSDSSSQQYITYSRYNIGGFTFVYESVLITPIFIYLIKSKRINIVLGIICIALIGFAVIKTEYTTALLLYLISLLLFFVGKLDRKRIVFLGLAAVFLLTIGRDWLSSLLTFIARQSESSTVVSRIEYLISVLNETETSNLTESGDRMTLYLHSLNTFVSRPFLGAWGAGRTSGHSYILDSLANYGLFGAAALFVQYRCIYKLYIRSQRTKDHYYYLIWIFLMGIILAIVNTKPFLFVFIIVLALLNSLIEGKQAEENVEKFMDCK